MATESNGAIAAASAGAPDEAVQQAGMHENQAWAQPAEGTSGDATVALVQVQSRSLEGLGALASPGLHMHANGVGASAAEQWLMKQCEVQPCLCTPLKSGIFIAHQGCMYDNARAVQ